MSTNVYGCLSHILISALRSEPLWMFRDTGNDSRFSVYKRNIHSMKKQPQSARGRYVSAEKVQQALAQLGIELCAGRKRIRAARSEKSISFFINGGTVNITFNEKGGKE